MPIVSANSGIYPCAIAPRDPDAEAETKNGEKALLQTEPDIAPQQREVASAHSPRVLSIQILRGVAACFVVLYHTDIILGQRNYGNNSQFAFLAQWGWLGVNLFFVISGFTIFLAHHRDIGLPKRLARYTWRRLVRIYPIYWLLMIAFLVATNLKADYRPLDIRPANLLTAISLLPFVQDPELPLKVAWTMLFEVMFYALFAVAIANRALARILWPTWLIAILTSTFVFGRYALDPLNIYNIYFILGGIVWWIMPKVQGRWIIPILILLAASIAVASRFANPLSNVDHDNLALALLAPPIALSLTLCVALEKFRPRLFTSRALLLVGDASYSIYLVHSAFLSVAGAAQSAMLGWVPGIVYFCLAGIGAILVGTIVHLVIERPMLASLRGRIAAKTAEKGAVS